LSELVSCVIPVRDGEAFLADAIESALTQATAVAEILVVDDGSSDASAAVAEAFGAPVRVIRRPPEGPVAARNCGVGEARGTLIGFLDSDDIWLPRKLELQMGRLRAHPEEHVVQAVVEQFQEPGAPEAVARMLGPPIAGFIWSSGLFRASAFESFGLPDPSLRLAEAAIEWFRQARSAGLRLGTVNQVLVRRRLHGANLSIIEDPMDSMLEMLKRRIDAQGA